MNELIQRIADLLLLIYENMSTQRQLQLVPLQEEVWLDAYQVKDLLKISDRSLYRMRINGELEVKKIGRKWFYKQSSIKRHFG